MDNKLKVILTPEVEEFIQMFNREGNVVYGSFRFRELDIENHIWEQEFISDDVFNTGCVTIQDDNWGGWESGGRWLAWRVNNTDDIPPEADSPNDDERYNFWKNYKGIVGKGNTPNDALISMCKQIKEKYGSENSNTRQ